MLFFDMLHALADDGADVVVVQRVEDGLPVPAAADQPGLLQNAQLV